MERQKSENSGFQNLYLKQAAASPAGNFLEVLMLGHIQMCTVRSSGGREETSLLWEAPQDTTMHAQVLEPPA